MFDALCVRLHPGLFDDDGNIHWIERPHHLDGYFDSHSNSNAERLFIHSRLLSDHRISSRFRCVAASTCSQLVLSHRFQTQFHSARAAVARSRWFSLFPFRIDVIGVQNPECARCGGGGGDSCCAGWLQFGEWPFCPWNVRSAANRLRTSVGANHPVENRLLRKSSLLPSDLGNRTANWWVVELKFYEKDSSDEPVVLILTHYL